jgi:hypothetical protein
MLYNVGGALSYYYGFYYDNFGELNIKAGSQFVGKIASRSTEEDNVSVNLDIGFCVTAEYLIYCGRFSQDLEFLKFGPGFSYLFPRGIDVKDGKDSYSYLPIYFTLQANPFISAFDEYLHGIFVKGSIGYNVLFDFKSKEDYSKLNNNGGVYYGISGGYEFSFGVIIEVGYHVYKSKIEVVHGDGSFGKANLTNSNVTVNVGYKFKT